MFLILANTDYLIQAFGGLLLAVIASITLIEMTTTICAAYKNRKQPVASSKITLPDPPKSWQEIRTQKKITNPYVPSDKTAKQIQDELDKEEAEFDVFWDEGDDLDNLSDELDDEWFDQPEESKEVRHEVVIDVPPEISSRDLQTLIFNKVNTYCADNNVVPAVVSVTLTLSLKNEA